MSRKGKILAGIFLLILAASGIAYATTWKCTTCGMTIKMKYGVPDGEDGECSRSSTSKRRHNWQLVSD
jgi:hypothetical protein